MDPKKLVRAVLAKRNHQLVPNRIVMAEFQVAHLLQQHGADCVLDVGANLGQFATGLRSAGYQGPMLSFEPGSQAFQRLTDLAAADPAWDVRKVALADEAGELTLNVSESTDLSSFLPISDRSVAEHPDWRVIETEQVPIMTLDDALADQPYQRIFLKSDTQGYDLKVLAGADRTLEQVIGLQIEASVIPVYERMPDYVEAFELLRDRGFILNGMYPLGFGYEQPAEFDAIFLRRDLVL